MYGMCSIMSEAYHSIKRIVRAGWCQGEGGGGGGLGKLRLNWHF